ncbi:MAG TPA: 1-deoxy-D-xylulose-5-phosphate reductoisomerase, partial [Blastocatellia bacterium]|nr:1-deoxy-D-xylulose-5-phosphate reductoisomerase [Blastocatellia bacterium]
MKTISILGCTGSIGQSTLSVVESLKDRFQVSALAAGRDIDKLAEQVAKFEPELVSVSNESDIPGLKERLAAAKLGKLPEIHYGDAGLIAVACHSGVDIVVSGTVGAVGFVPTYKALCLGRRVCLANKETLVMS